MDFRLLQKRLVKFLLKRLIGPYLSTELNVDQLDVQLTAGELRLTGVGLNPEAFQSSGIPIDEGWIEECRINIPFTSILAKSCELTLNGLHLTLLGGANGDDDDDDSQDSLVTARQSSMLQSIMMERHSTRQQFAATTTGTVTPTTMTRSLIIAQTFLEETRRQTTTTPASANTVSTRKTSSVHSLIEKPPDARAAATKTGGESDEGMQMIAMLIDRIVQQINIQINDIQIKIPSLDNYGDGSHYYTIYIPSVQYSDISTTGSLSAAAVIQKAFRFSQGFSIRQPGNAEVVATCEQECSLRCSMDPLPQTPLQIAIDVPRLTISGSPLTLAELSSALAAPFNQLNQADVAASDPMDMQGNAATVLTLTIQTIIVDCYLNNQVNLRTILNSFRLTAGEGEMKFSANEVQVLDQLSDNTGGNIIASAKPKSAGGVCLRGQLGGLNGDELVVDLPCQLQLTISAQEFISKLVNQAFTQRTTADRSESSLVTVVNIESLLAIILPKYSSEKSLTLEATNVRLLFDDPVQSLFVQSAVIRHGTDCVLIQLENGLQLRTGGYYASNQLSNAEMRALIGRHGGSPTQFIAPKMSVTVDSPGQLVDALEIFNSFPSQSTITGSQSQSQSSIVLEIGQIDWRDPLYRFQIDQRAILVSSADTVILSLCAVQIASENSSPAAVKLCTSVNESSDTANVLFRMDREGSMFLHLSHLALAYNRPPVDPLFEHIQRFYMPILVRNTADTGPVVETKMSIKLTDFAISFTADPLGTLQLIVQDAILSLHHPFIKYHAQINQCSLKLCPSAETMDFAELMRFFDLQLLYSCAALSNTDDDTPSAVSIAVDLNRLIVDTCCDSLVTLVDVLTVFIDQLFDYQIETAENAGDDDRYLVDDRTAVMKDIDENAFRKRPTQQNSPSQRAAQQSLPLVEDYFGVASQPAEKTFDFDSLQVQMQSIANAARNSEEDEDAADWKEAAMQIPTRLQQPPPVSRILRGGTGEPVPVIENYFETINQTTPVSIGDSGNIHSQPRQEFHPQLVVSVKCTELVWKLWSGFDWPANQEAERLKRQRKPVTADKPVNNDLYGSEIEIIVSERGNESTVRFIEHQHSIPAVEGESHGSTDELSGDNETRQQSPAERFARNDRNSMQCIMKQLNVAYKVFSLPGTADNIADDDYDYYRRSSHLQLNVRDVDVLDDLSTSVWHKFLTSCQPMDDLQDRQRLRETNSDMIVLQLTGVRPDLNRPRSLEYRLHLDFLPLRFHVDQDALTFLGRFFAFRPSYSPLLVSPSTLETEDRPVVSAHPLPVTYFQLCDISGVQLQVDYKPKRVDYVALQQGQYAELLNFFHLESADIQLKRLQLRGINGWSRLWDCVISEWLPHITNTQLPNLVTGLAPLRTLVNVGESVVDLIVLPVEQYRKDGRLAYGLRKGASQFFRNIGTEGAKIGARLAIGTQTILETAAGSLIPPSTQRVVSSRGGDGQLISKYANSPTDFREGLRSAASALTTAVNDTIETIIAVPSLNGMDDAEADETLGEASSSTAQAAANRRRILKAIPIAVLKPILGATEAIKQTMLGAHSSLQPGSHLQRQDKYKSNKYNE